jgi:hypothetical protein
MESSHMKFPITAEDFLVRGEEISVFRAKTGDRLQLIGIAAQIGA